jgi:choline kinase
LTGIGTGETKEVFVQPQTHVIVLAAGLGSRLKRHTMDKPKCLLEFGNKTLLQMQLESYAANSIYDVHVVRGYKKEKIMYRGITYHENPDFQDSNILHSLFCAESALEGHVIVSYSDILFEPFVVGRLLQSQHDISIVVDIDWRGYYVGRDDHPVEEAEVVILDAENNVIRIGKNLTQNHGTHGEFIGMMKFTPRGADTFKRHYHRAKALYAGSPFQRAREFQQAYLTDLIQEMTQLGVRIHCVCIEQGWKEIDTERDYEKAVRDFNSTVCPANSLTSGLTTEER